MPGDHGGYGAAPPHGQPGYGQGPAGYAAPEHPGGGYPPPPVQPEWDAATAPWDAPAAAGFPHPGSAGHDPAYGAMPSGGAYDTVGAGPYGTAAPGEYATAGAVPGTYGAPPGTPGESLGMGAEERLRNLQGEVASLRIRGGSNTVERFVKVGGAGLMVLGVALIIAGYLKASTPNTSVNNQFAYLFSAGLPGMALVGVGAAVYLRSWIARLRYWQARSVVEHREYTDRMLQLLARIEALLGGTGTIPSGESGEEHAGWDSFALDAGVTEPARNGDESPREAPREAPAARDITEARGAEPARDADVLRPAVFTDEIHTAPDAQPAPQIHAAHVDPAALASPGDYAEPAQAFESTRHMEQPAHHAEPAHHAAPAHAEQLGARAHDVEPVTQTETLPVYANEHGHLWDHAAQQWYDPESHQWFDGIVGHWYRRDSTHLIQG